MNVVLRAHAGPVTLDEVTSIVKGQGWPHNLDGAVFTCSLPNAKLVDIELFHSWAVQVYGDDPMAIRQAVGVLLRHRPDLDALASTDFWSAA